MLIYIADNKTKETLRMFDSNYDFVPSVGDTISFTDRNGRNITATVEKRKFEVGVDMDDVPCFETAILFVDIDYVD